MNDRVFEIGENVSDDFELKLFAIVGRTLKFQDSEGVIYDLKY